MKRAIVYGVVVLAALAVVVPSLRRATSTPGVQGGLGDLRTLMAAETAYANVNGGYFDVPKCLGTPDSCVPARGAHRPPLVDADLAALRPHTGYQFRFEPGPSAPSAEVRRQRLSESSLTSYAIVAAPVSGGAQRRAFCGDSTGRVCARDDGRMPAAVDGLCPRDCETLAAPPR